MPAAHAPAVLGRRVCAVAAVCSASLHGSMIGHAGSTALALLILVMAAGCLFCAYELWTSGSLRAWCFVAVMNLLMVAVHWSVPAHHHGGTNAAVLGGVAAVPASLLMTTATILALAEAAVATVVLWVRTRHRTISVVPQPN